MTWRSMDTVNKDRDDVILVSVPGFESYGTSYPPTSVPARYSHYDRDGVRKYTLYDMSDCDRDGGYDHVHPEPIGWMPLPDPRQVFVTEQSA